MYRVAQERLGAGNLAAVEAVAGWFTKLSGGGDFDPTDPRSMVEFLDALPGRVGEGLVADLNGLAAELKTTIQAKLTDAVTKAGVQLAAKFVPGVGGALSAFRGLQWALANRHQMGDVFTKFLEALDGLGLNEADATAHVKDRMLLGFKAAVVPLMNLAAGQLGLGNLRAELQRAAAYVPQRVAAAIGKAVDAIASRAPAAGSGTAAVPGGTRPGADDLFNGRLAPAKEFAYQDTTYVLWAAQDKTGTKVKIAEKTGGTYRYVGELTAASFIGNRARAEINALIAAARELHNKSKPNPHQPANKDTVPAMLVIQQRVTAALDKVRQAIQANACVALGTGCFAAGTRLLTRTGWRNVEDIQLGEEVLSRSEHDAAAVAEWKAVEARFERTGCILHLHVGGEVIRTTPEHPFYVAGKGWTQAGALREGDRLATLTGEWVAVGEVYDTQQWEPVYNLRVADHHTYFVGDDGWGFAAWAHNAYNIKFLSALKVVEEVNYHPGTIGELTQSDQNTIIQTIRNHGKYGAMGDREALVDLLQYELWFERVDPGYTPDVGGVVQKHLNLPCVKAAREKEERRIDNRKQWQATLPGETKTSYGWAVYIYTQLGDRDARGKSYVQARQDVIDGGGDPTRQNQKIHGHHIVYKDGGTRSANALEASKHARDILLYYGINPYWDKENLAYAPNQGHSEAIIQDLRRLLKAAFDDRGSREAIVEILRTAANSYFPVSPGGTP